MISAIIPVFNEEENIKELHREVAEALSKVDSQSEIIFVNDGSSDNSEAVLKSLPKVKIISFRRNFGQTAALSAGFNLAQGDLVVTMDGDGQNDPADIPAMVAELNAGFDVVCGWRAKRRDSFSKRFVSKGAKFLRRFLVRDQVHDSGCTLRVYRREAADILKNISGETHRFIAALLVAEGFKVGEIKVNHRPRRFGKTKYNWRRTVKGFLDMIGIWFWRSYSSRPLHLFGGVGFALTALGVALGVALFVLRLWFGYPLNDKIWPLVFVLLIVSGLQFLISGLLSDIAVKQYYQTTGKKHYSIKAIIETE